MAKDAASAPLVSDSITLLSSLGGIVLDIDPSSTASNTPSSAPSQLASLAPSSAAICDDNLNFECRNLEHWDTEALFGGDIVAKCTDDKKEVGSCFAQITASMQNTSDGTCESATLSRKVILKGISGEAEYFEIEYWYRFKDIDSHDTMEIVMEDLNNSDNTPFFQQKISPSSGTGTDTADTGWIRGLASLGSIADGQQVKLSMKFSVTNGASGIGGCTASRNSQGLLDGINIITHATTCAPGNRRHRL